MTVMGKIQVDAKQKASYVTSKISKSAGQGSRSGQGTARRRGVKPVTSIFQISHNETDINYTYPKFIF